MIISLNNIRKSYGPKTILDNISFSIDDNEKVAFAGVNGAGKTTLFKIVAGEISPDGGEVNIAKNTTVSYLPQNAEFESGLTVYEEMMTAFSDLTETENKMRELETEMSGHSSEKLIEEYNGLIHFYEANDGYRYKSLVRGVIAGLGLSGADAYNKKISELSGGQKTRALLGKTLLKKPDLLLLDEPTNHLDVATLGWLENYLKSYEKTVLVISHDRFFMDAVVSRVIELENGRAASYKGGWSDFAARKQINFDLAQKHYKDAQKEIKKQEEAIKLLKSFNRQKSVRRAESMEKRLEKTEAPEKPQTRADMSLKLNAKKESGFDVLSVSDISKSYGANLVLSDISFEIKRGERIALIGANGIGKTTLLKLIMSETRPDSGFIRRGVNVSAGYYDQERSRLDETKTIFAQAHDAYPKLTDGEIRNILAAFLFRGDDVFKLISELSGGERGRVSLALLMLSGSNFLVLDEPTNHLDTYSKEILENALVDYGGTYLCVSHDRYFINRVATRVLELTRSGIVSYSGNYDYYLRKKTEESDNTENQEKSVTQKQSSETRSRKNEWLERKAENADARRRAALIKKIELKIEETEAEISRLDEMMCSPEVFSDFEKSREAHELKTALDEELEKLYAEWERANESKDTFC